MIRFRPYREGDVLAIERAGAAKPPPSVDELARSSWAFSAIMDERVIGSGGILRMGPWRGMAWAHFAAGLPLSAWTRILRRCRTVLALAAADGIAVIEAEVAVGYLAGHRFARTLGFRFAGILPAPGGAFARYVRTSGAAEWPHTRVRALLALTDETLAHSLLREVA